VHGRRAASGFLPSGARSPSTQSGRLRTRHIVPLLAIRLTAHGSGLGQWRWVVERTLPSSVGFTARGFGMTSGSASTRITLAVARADLLAVAAQDLEERLDAYAKFPSVQ
jgi:hypothetical protein